MHKNPSGVPPALLFNLDNTSRYELSNGATASALRDSHIHSNIIEVAEPYIPAF